MKSKIKKGDNVIVIAGQDKGRRGEVIRCLDSSYLLVSGVNVGKKHMKGNPQRNIQGGIVDRERPIHISNVALYNPVTQQADRVGVKYLPPATIGGGTRKVRYFKSNNEIVELL